MCVFVGPQPVGRVAFTRIFARFGAGRPRRWLRGPIRTQLLAYSMRVGLAADTVMILPLPVAHRRGEDAVRFIDLSGYKTLLADLEQLVFPPPPPMQGPQGAIGGAAPRLAVHAVGSYIASFVPRRADFSRLDSRFQIPKMVWDAMPDYSDWGFAVFTLSQTNEAEFHPMAFEFPTRFDNKLFFPTVHVHDGTFHPMANYQHTLFAQARTGLPSDWGPGHDLAPRLDIPKSNGVLDARAPIFGRRLVGDLENRDTYAELV